MFWLSGGGVRWEFSVKSSSRKFSGPKEQTSCEVLQLEPKWQTTAARMRSPPQHVTWWRNLTAQRAESQNEVKTVGNERWFVSCRYKVELEYPQDNIGREIQVAGFKSSGAPTWRRRRNLRAWIQIKPPTHDETYILPHHASAEHCGVISRYFFQINFFIFWYSLHLYIRTSSNVSVLETENRTISCVSYGYYCVASVPLFACFKCDFTVQHIVISYRNWVRDAKNGKNVTLAVVHMCQLLFLCACVVRDFVSFRGILRGSKVILVG